MMTLRSTELWEFSTRVALAPRVLASRFSSWVRKSRRRPWGPGPAEDRAGFLNVDAQPVELFRDVCALGQQGDLLLESRRVHLDLQIV